MYNNSEMKEDSEGEVRGEVVVDPSDLSVHIHGGAGTHNDIYQPEHLQQKPTKKNRQQPPQQQTNQPRKPLRMAEIATVAGERTKSQLPSSKEVNINERDPEQINQHLKVAFFEIFAEPHPTIFSFDIIWKIAFQVFEYVKLWTYRIVTFLFAIPLAIFWAIYFGLLAFFHIWCCVPIYRAYLIKLLLLKKFFIVAMEAFVTPVTGAVGKIFAHFRVTLVKGEPETEIA